MPTRKPLLLGRRTYLLGLMAALAALSSLAGYASGEATATQALMSFALACIGLGQVTLRSAIKREGASLDPAEMIELTGTIESVQPGAIHAQYLLEAVAEWSDGPEGEAMPLRLRRRIAEHLAQGRPADP